MNTRYRTTIEPMQVNRPFADFHSRSGVTKTLGIVIVSALIIAYFAYVSLTPEIGSPDESRRIKHPAGFSIVVPEGYQSSVVIGDARTDDSIRCVPIKVEGRYGEFTVTRYARPPANEKMEKDGYVAGTFMGQPARELILLGDSKKNNWLRGYIFERDGQTYGVMLTRPRSEPITGKAWTRYVESFRIEPAIKFKYVTTLPSMQPAR